MKYVNSEIVNFCKYKIQTINFKKITFNKKIKLTMGKCDGTGRSENVCLNIGGKHTRSICLCEKTPKDYSPDKDCPGGNIFPQEWDLERGESCSCSNVLCLTGEGRKLVCKLKSFGGDLFSCCLRRQCFLNNGVICPPELRNGSNGIGCVNAFKDNFILKPNNIEELSGTWFASNFAENYIKSIDPCNANNIIENLAQRYFLSLSGTFPSKNQESLIDCLGKKKLNLDKLIKEAFDNIRNPTGSQVIKFITTKTGCKFNFALDILLPLAQQFPGSIDSVLKQVCAGFTRSQIANNPNQVIFCGCFLPDIEYDTNYGQFGIEKVCDPVCSIDSALKPIDPKTRPFINQGGLCTNIPAFLECDQTICVIDNVNIKITDSTTGNINFDQVCGNCNKPGVSKASCSCFISNIDFEAIESQIGNVTLMENCGSSLKCFKDNKAGLPPLIVECESGNSTGETEAFLKKLEAELGINERTLFIIVGFIILAILVIGGFFIFGRKEK